MNFNDLATPDITRKDIDYVCDHDTGKLWILHGKPLPMQKTLKSASFDLATGQITFHGSADQAYPVKVPIKPPLSAAFSTSDSVTVVWTDKGKIYDLHVLPLSAV